MSVLILSLEAIHVIWKYISKNTGFHYSETITDIKPTANSLILIAVGVTVDYVIGHSATSFNWWGKGWCNEGLLFCLLIRHTKTCVCKEVLLKSQMKYKHVCHQLEITQYMSWPPCSLLYLLLEPANVMACSENLWRWNATRKTKVSVMSSLPFLWVFNRLWPSGGYVYHVV